jgi:hypothetical protein
MVRRVSLQSGAHTTRGQLATLSLKGVPLSSAASGRVLKVEWSHRLWNIPATNAVTHSTEASMLAFAKN